MLATVVRHVMVPALLPGATGRADGFAGERAAVVAALAGSLAAGREAHGDVPAARGTAGVLVVAPARCSRRTVEGRPEPGALGLEPTSRLAVARDLAGAHEGPGVHAARPRDPLDVVAGVAVTLLGLAGWDGAIETVERGGVETVQDDVDLHLDDRRLVVFALASPEPLLPPGAHAGLAAGHAEVWQLAARYTSA